MTVTIPAKRAFIIRPARPADAAAIADLGAHTFTTTFGHSVTAEELQAFLDESYTTAAIEKDLEDADRDVIVAVDTDEDSNNKTKNNGDKVLGFAYLTRNSVEPCLAHLSGTAELQRIYVHPAAHGKGVGSALSGRITAMAREQGFDKLWLGVWMENYKAIRTYERWGYRKVGHHDFKVGPVVQTDHIMLKEDLSS
ncbi:acyl-CoA N-acyltransferase [Microdochium trichocladiopsis]|uniref:Acyl-CoA N-acyltransferase n=1 Tax=Microdochium trichocladiopsis TaxID=1682393 RepID=A0A9P9BQ84_9PEZI|nr:acyl-CoA N-acyltransferase [Microdochium trichocladiopsis]KAH7030677.1 acyl-CoA N-acyltransferase [Microdochium trichocladiopsis]